ncbi:MAG: crossover junction endodeoxyribonuclease RuvC [Kiritimatiellae bacterium]|nr:crossover junction endodeoxyribonuclease RuvC [Kiritimatiellia bacterium]
MAGRADSAGILGLDTALRCSGYAVIRRAGAGWEAVELGRIHNPAGRPVAIALLHLHAELSDLLRRHAPAAVAIEGVFHARNARTLLALGQARGAVLVACAAAGIPVFEYSPREVKRGVTGHGQADKSQVARMVQAMLGLPAPPPPDEADAAAIALCHAHATGARALGLVRRLDAAHNGDPPP